jgi:hypothetical protein
VALFEAGAPKRDDAIFQPLHALMEVGWLLIALLVPPGRQSWGPATLRAVVSAVGAARRDANF